MKHMCPVCGYDKLPEPAYDGERLGILLSGTPQTNLI